VKRFLAVSLMGVTLALCAVCVAQWAREAFFRGRINELERDVAGQGRLRAEAVAQAEVFTKEIERLTTLRADTEARLLEMTARVQAMEQEQGLRDEKRDALESEVQQLRAEGVAAREVLARSTAAVASQNNAVEEHNAIIEKASTQLKKVTAERDEAIEKLNARTRAYNELVNAQRKTAR
jgi:chromosome segregation ATPase